MKDREGAEKERERERDASCLGGLRVVFLGANIRTSGFVKDLISFKAGMTFARFTRYLRPRVFRSGSRAVERQIDSSVAVVTADVMTRVDSSRMCDAMRRKYPEALKITVLLLPLFLFLLFVT